jgi:hypothetical protein
LAWNRDNMSQVGRHVYPRTSFSELALCKKNPTKHDGLVQSGPRIISFKINLFSPSYSWTIAELAALKNNLSLTQTRKTCLERHQDEVLL